MIKTILFILVVSASYHHAIGAPNDDPPEHHQEYYLSRSVPDIHQLMEGNIRYIAPIVAEAQRQYKAVGLSVAALFYEDSKALVRKQWPRVLCALDSYTTQTNKSTMAAFATEIYGWHHLVDRLKVERAATPLIPANEDETEMKSLLMAREQNVTMAINMAVELFQEGGKMENHFLEKFHIMLRSWLLPEMDKLNQKIQELSDSKLRVNNMKVLAEDFQLLMQPPF